MNTILKSSTASCEIRSLGAELLSFRGQDIGEALWQGDPIHWAGTSPVLFPIVCALNDGKARFGGRAYAIGNHGFPRKQEFSLVEASATRAVYTHTWTEKTLELYPFRYKLTILYTLSGNRLEVRYRVANLGDGVMPFQIGTHPGLRCPLTEGEKFEDSFLEFEKDEVFERFFLNVANTLIVGKSEKLTPGKVLPLTHELFGDGALVFKTMASKKVRLKSKKSPRAVVLTWDNLPAMGIWQPKDAPFVCLEPWHGLADSEDFTGEFSKKELVVTLKPGKSWECWHAIELL